MLVVLLLLWVVSSVTTTTQCPRSGCRCPDYTVAICSGSLTENFTNLFDSRLLNLTLQATSITEVTCDTIPEGIEKLLLLRNSKLSAISFDCDWIRTVQHLEISAARLSELYPITDQHIDSLNMSGYTTLPNLHKLYLSHLRISNSFELLLKLFSNVPELYFNHDDINVLANPGVELPYIKLLDLSYNPIKNISLEFFRSMINLDALHLEWDKLTIIRGNVFHALEQLTFLRLDGNNFTSFEDDTFLQLYNLRKLRVSNNQIDYFQSALTRNLTKLEELYLNDNKLYKLEEHIFDSLISLKVLNITQNLLTSIHNMIFKNQKKLQKLYLGWNKLENIENTTFVPLQSLHTLNLESNRLTFIEHGTFEKLSNLKQLNLSGNLLMEISGVQFPQRSKLQKLFLQRNSLGNIDPMTFRPLEKLEILRLDGNDFRKINFEAFEYLKNLKNLNLSECNMLECSCDLEKLWKFCNLRNITTADGVCYENSTYSMQWSSLKICPLEELGGGYINTIIIIIASVLVLLLVISYPVVRYLLQCARSDASTWSPQNNNTTHINRLSTHVSKEEDYDFVTEEGTVGFSKFTNGHMEDYVEPTAPKVLLPICKPMENSKKKRKVSIPFQRIYSSGEITAPQCRAPAAPPED